MATYGARDEQQIRQYLLGRAEPDEALHPVEERSFDDREFLQSVLDCEAALIDEYLDGDLDPHERNLFEHNFLRSQRRRAQLQFASDLRLKARAEASAALSQTPFRNGRSARRPAPHSDGLKSILLLAAGVLLCVAAPSVILLMQRQGLSRVSPQTEPAAAQLPPRQEAPSLVFRLIPGTDRAQGASQRRLSLPSNAASVQFELTLDRAVPYTVFRASLQTVDGAELWSRENLRMKEQGSETQTPRISVTVPASNLPPETLVIVLSGLAGSRWQPVSDYTFRVLKE